MDGTVVKGEILRYIMFHWHKELLTELFYSWRPYKLILKRLNEVHGCKRRLALSVRFTFASMVVHLMLFFLHSPFL